ncbi:MAG TPA: dienelactone hydrolase family protein [Candidatus Paenibacillus intestinavium]|nr:dienelactone hydrolase family protein [Candidatus Paenibacillus intestinavium]
MKTAYEYAIHLPANYDRDKKYPTIFTLHGKGSDENNMYHLVEPLNEQFIIVGIRGNVRLGMGYQYYVLKSLGNPIREMFDLAIQDLELFISYATDRYSIDANKRYLLGFSQGAILSMSLALTMGHQLKGIVALNGYVPHFVKAEYSLQSVEDVSMFISHGEHDSVFPVKIGYETAEYFQKKTSHITFNIYPSDHGVIEENRNDFVEWLMQDSGVSMND